ncbi:unnamed protein product [Clonostachys rosea f. rosea IK726]|uniref:Uncharacterized protein n=1 Tax=Clonostachys rosea f. rosea IK726 TaxID=1349383 RepID=A0ACA9UNW7_BIOOC|nr:unnamed protein product [Clonostachys rosea f. rosea IK726]
MPKKFKAARGSLEEAHEQMAHWAKKVKEHIAALKEAETKKNYAVKKLDDLPGPFSAPLPSKEEDEKEEKKEDEAAGVCPTPISKMKQPVITHT